MFSKIFLQNKLLQQILPLRKHAGVLLFLIILAHAIFHFLRAGVLGDWTGMYFESVESDWAILFGVISFLILLPLFLTSTNFACKKMGYKSWKFLQRFTHLAFISAAIHVIFIKFSQYSEIDFNALSILIIYLLGYLWLFSRKTKKVSTPRT